MKGLAKNANCESLKKVEGKSTEVNAFRKTTSNWSLETHDSERWKV